MVVCGEGEKGGGGKRLKGRLIWKREKSVEKWKKGEKGGTIKA